mgnify:CR=1 FL=1
MYRKSFVKGFLAGLYHIAFRVKKVGTENLDMDDGYIICANHLNYLDAAGIVLLNKRYIRFVAKSDLYRIPILSWLGHLFNIIPIKRGKNDIASIKICLKALKNKEVLGIFPEGTRNGIKKGLKPKTGVAYFALNSNATVIPVGIKGGEKPFKKATITYGKPLDLEGYKGNKELKKDKEILVEVTGKIMEKIIELAE